MKFSSSYRIGELCAHFSVSPRALRFYEEKGLLAPDRDFQQTRLYSRGDFNRVRLISWGRRATLSLEEIRELLDEYDAADQGRAQLAKALSKLREKAEELDAQRAHLGGEIERLEGMLAGMDTEADREQDAA
ncbi:MAG TPA: MerR family transcriptional regulator [Caulobacteraceae bacterium]|jgi:DNA-binding transcriptional MerR regulator|nr:MerR family transcriptional regulator [Caulobacteraceae bacterium]